MAELGIEEGVLESEAGTTLTGTDEPLPLSASTIGVDEHGFQSLPGHIRCFVASQ